MSALAFILAIIIIVYVRTCRSRLGISICYVTGRAGCHCAPSMRMRPLWPARGKTCASLHLLPQVLSLEELREALAKESAPLMQARATYDFDPQNERELQFKKVWQL